MIGPEETPAPDDRSPARRIPQQTSDPPAIGTRSRHDRGALLRDSIASLASRHVVDSRAQSSSQATNAITWPSRNAEQQVHAMDPRSGWFEDHVRDRAGHRHRQWGSGTTIARNARCRSSRYTAPRSVCAPGRPPSRAPIRATISASITSVCSSCIAPSRSPGGEILVHLRGDRVVAANSKLVLALDVSTTPTLSAADAEQQARDLMRRLYP